MTALLWQLIWHDTIGLMKCVRQTERVLTVNSEGDKLLLWRCTHRVRTHRLDDDAVRSPGWENEAEVACCTDQGPFICRVERRQVRTGCFHSVLNQFTGSGKEWATVWFSYINFSSSSSPIRLYCESTPETRWQHAFVDMSYLNADIESHRKWMLESDINNFVSWLFTELCKSLST